MTRECLYPSSNLLSSTPSIIQFSLTKNRHSYPHGKIEVMPIHKEVNKDFFKKWSSEMADIGAKTGVVGSGNFLPPLFPAVNLF